MLAVLLAVLLSCFIGERLENRGVCRPEPGAVVCLHWSVDSFQKPVLRPCFLGEELVMIRCNDRVV